MRDNNKMMASKTLRSHRQSRRSRRPNRKRLETVGFGVHSPGSQRQPHDIHSHAFEPKSSLLCTCRRPGKDLDSCSAISPLDCSDSVALEQHEWLSPEEVSQTGGFNLNQACGMCVGGSFSVRMHDYFGLRRLVADNQSSGIIHTEFDPFRNINVMSLTDDAKKLLDVPNAGGSSVVSEMLSYEVLQRCFGARLIKTEMEVEYFPVGGAITDYTCQMFGVSLGVSVTRAMKHRGQFSQRDARRLLDKKLKGVLQSSKNTLESWAKQILHIWTMNSDTANIVITTYEQLDEQVKSNTLVLVTVASSGREIFSVNPERNTMDREDVIKSRGF